MSLSLVSEITSELPWSMRSALEGYTAAVNDARFEIFADTKTQYTKELYDEFIFLVTVQRLWSLVESQYWILSNSLKLLRESGADAMQVGSTDFHTKSKFFKQLRSLRNELDLLLRREQLSMIVTTRNPAELLVTLRDAQ